MMVNLKKLIADKGMSQRQFAMKIGIDPSALCRYIKNERIPNVSAAIKIARELGIDAESLIDEKMSFDLGLYRITIRDIIDLLDYDRTGIRTVRIVDDDTKQTDMLHTNSHLLEFIEDIPVNTLDTANGVITLYCTFKEATE